jgi:hypothetical protein
MAFPRARIGSAVLYQRKANARAHRDKGKDLKRLSAAPNCFGERGGTNVGLNNGGRDLGETLPHGYASPTNRAPACYVAVWINQLSNADADSPHTCSFAPGFLNQPPGESQSVRQDPRSGFEVSRAGVILPYTIDRRSDRLQPVKRDRKAYNSL